MSYLWLSSYGVWVCMTVFGVCVWECLGYVFGECVCICGVCMGECLWCVRGVVFVMCVGMCVCVYGVYGDVYKVCLRWGMLCGVCGECLWMCVQCWVCEV